MRIGVEIEFTGVSRGTVANTLAFLWDSRVHLEEFEYDGDTRVRYGISDNLGRCWYLYVDKSINPTASETTRNLEEYMCEVVSPVVDSSETTIYEVINVIKSVGGVVNSSCGVHIHVDSGSVGYVDRLISVFLMEQEFLSNWFRVECSRLEKYCKLYPPEFIEKYLNASHKGFSTVSEIQDIFYEEFSEGISRDYDKNPTRYYMLNIDSIHKRGTIEFRFFNSTLDSDELCSYIDFVESFCRECEDKDNVQKEKEI